MAGILKIENGRCRCLYCKGTGRMPGRPCLVCGNAFTPGTMPAELLKPFIVKEKTVYYLDGRHRRQPV